jgi:hypothetical protein
VEWGGLLEWVKIGGLSQQGLTAGVCVWWGDVCCSGSAVGSPREVIRGTLAAIREGAAFGLRFDSRGRVGIWRGTPRRGLDSGLVQGGSSTPENIEDMPYHVPRSMYYLPSPMAHRVSYPSPYIWSIDPFS